MEESRARGIVKVMVASYVYDQSWKEDQLDFYRDEAWQALELLGLSRDFVINGEADDDY